MPGLLGYWNIRGLCQPIRFMLEYVGEAYEEKLYSIGPAPDFDPKMWLDEKFNLALPFPNLPYYIDNDVKLSQTLAILKYISRKHGLIGNATDTHNIEMVENHLMDSRWHLAMHCYGRDFRFKPENYIKESLSPALKMLDSFLGDKSWLFKELTYVDFLLYELLAVSSALDSETIEKFPKLKSFQTRFESFEKIKAYMKSSRFIEYPYHAPMALKLG